MVDIYSLISKIILLASLSSAVDESSFTLIPDYSYNNQVSEQTLLWQQSFGNSWNTPSNTPFTPQTTDFSRVVLELQVNSTGANYDRLAQMFVDDIEIWRTSTAEPDNHGTTWTVRKDVSLYADLFKTQRTINFLIENRVTNEFTGVFYVTLKAYFYNDETSGDQTDESWIADSQNPPSQIQALAKSSGTPGSSWSAPGDDISVNVGPLDKSVNRAVLHIFASGNGDDEFWWDSPLSGTGPARFIDVYVGSQFAGFASPYPVIYSGGVNPYLWKPLVDIKTFDVPAYLIDVTPFLPALWDGSTPISLNMTNGANSDSIPSNWIITYNLLTWSTPGQSNSGTTNSPQYSSEAPSQSGSVLVNRSLTTSASLNIGGQQQEVKWEQNVEYNNTQVGSPATHVWQATHGSSAISGLYNFDLDFNFPFQVEMDNSDYFRVEQTYETDAKNQSYYTWIDSSVWLNGPSGTFNKSESSQYVKVPNGAHYASTNDMNVVVQW